MLVEIRQQPFEPWRELARVEAVAGPASGSFGATCVFVGSMRDFNEGEGVTGMTLEYYPGMTERHLQRICDEAIARWQVDDAYVAHRVGPLEPGEPIVLIAVWSAHRGAAFEACRFIIEDLKHRAPFWKKEQRADGEHWVDRNTGADENVERKP